MTYIVCCSFSPFAPYGCSKDVKAWAVVLTVPNCQDSAVLDNNGFLTRKKEGRFRGWTEIADCDASPESSLVGCEPSEDENCSYRPSIAETAGPRYKEWLGWYLGDKGSLSWKKGCQF